MARTTRSQKHADDSATTTVAPPPAPSSSKAKATSKKRKRVSTAAPEDEPAAKLPRNDDVVESNGVKEEEEPQESTDPTPVDTKGAGDIPLDPEDAQRILDILEMVDTQGLLDRVFPLPADSTLSSASSSQTSSQTQTYSFRTLLKESSRHPLRVLRSAVQPLFPVFAHPRSRPSAPAAQQLKFCNLALSLLDQSSFRASEAILSLETVIPIKTEAASTAADDATADPPKPAVTPPASPDPPRKRKYALMQKLPSGEWWTSLNSDTASLLGDGSELKGLPTAHAELVAILPSAPASEASGSTIPTLGSLSRKTHAKKPTLPGPRRLGTGSFLDYGPYASFAPSFEQDGVEVGRFTLGEVMWSRLKKRKVESALRVHARKGPQSSAPVEDVQMTNDTSNADTSGEMSNEAPEPPTEEPVINPSLSSDQAASLKEFMSTLDLEIAVQELLERNKCALARLEELQSQRLGGENGGSSQVEEGSEEWDVAQSISDSLALLMSLRPRSESDSSPFIPPPEILRKLHRTLPGDPSDGWRGTLPVAKLTALRDDNTLRIKAGVTLPMGALAGPAAAVATTPTTPAVPAAAVTATAAAAGKPATTPAQPSYAGYSYANYSAQYRGAYAYTPSTNPYYPNAYAQSSAAASAAAQTPGTAQAQAQAAYAGQQQYNSYGSWYNYQQHQAQGAGAAAAAAAGAGTPTTPITPLAASYASFFNAAQQAAPRAVANTVTAGKAAPAAAAGAGATPAAAGWPATPTLPAHLRPGVPQAPGTPTPAGQGGYYYPGYQQAAGTTR